MSFTMVCFTAQAKLTITMVLLRLPLFPYIVLISLEKEQFSQARLITCERERVGGDMKLNQWKWNRN